MVIRKIRTIFTTMKEKERTELISAHWEDEDFHKVREAFKDYLVYSGINMGDEYIQKIAHLLGVSFVVADEEGYDTWWELDEPEYIKFIKF